MHPLSADLIAKAMAGETGAIERLLTVARPDLHRYARRHCESGDIEEAVQDALWILYRKVGGLRSAAAFTGWIVQVVRRTCLRYMRRRQQRSAATLEGWDAPDAAASDAELRARLARSIARLTPNHRAVLLLKDVQGWSADETAQHLGIGLEATKSRLHRARAAVREVLGENSQPMTLRAKR
ncbi:RNA polymerase sigma factor [Sphingomonas sp.]|uniref:RNA polymerase sigma factor n=1 Tax=Sphingomonas sp. TaxID=28214 RepID=UPI003CC52B3E